MRNLIERHPTMQMLILAVAVVVSLYLATAVVDFLTVVNPADMFRLADFMRRHH
ncbi:hypothetical protein Q9S36_21015 [Microbacterium sp. ARD31]|uniref:hypothetical protein n=1 Tax=Microbacterium sp. ARD31 TaxID=2962576 RepID=UPI002882C7F2|nr:hypothetical protein [Microbacterium sp. ARD31]MDT0182659.1 hypothetical protein [Microbacterium sp. ARD31]